MGSRHRTAEAIAHVQVVRVNDRLMGAPFEALDSQGTGGGREDARACSAGICAVLLPAGPRSTVAAMSWPSADKETRPLP